MSGSLPHAGRLPWYSTGLAVGCLVGAVWFCSAGVLMIAALTVSLAWWINQKAAPEDRRFLLRLFLMGFLVRAALSIAMDTGSMWSNRQMPIATGVFSGPTRYPYLHLPDLGVFDDMRHPYKLSDSDHYSKRGYAIAEYVKGNRHSTILQYVGQPGKAYGWNGYSFVIGLYYYLFGFSPISVKLINCLIGALLGPLVFLLAQRCVNALVGRWAAVLTAYCPSLVLWSVSNLKEPSLLLLTAMLFWLFLKWSETRSVGWKVRYLGLFALAFAAHTTMRNPVYSMALLGALGVAYLLVGPMSRWTRCAVITLLVAAGVWQQARIAARFQDDVMHALDIHKGYLVTAGTSYRILPGEYYDAGLLATATHMKFHQVPWVSAAFKGAAHYLLEPFPWRTKNYAMLFSLPQTMVWYTLLPFVLIGLWQVLRRRVRDNLFIVLTIVAWIFLGGLTTGNVGTVFRMRDMVTPFLMIYASAGLLSLLCGRTVVLPPLAAPTPQV